MKPWKAAQREYVHRSHRIMREKKRFERFGPLKESEAQSLIQSWLSKNTPILGPSVQERRREWGLA